MSRERERFDEIGKKIKRGYSDASTKYNYHIGAGIRKQQQQQHNNNNNNNNNNNSNIMLWPPGTPNTITPCAACKLLRRRCAQECPFSPYFSPHEPQKFASVHKVFGASNVSKMLMEVPENQRADAANSLVYEANVRLRDPVYGCMGAISGLQQQVQVLQAELNVVKAEIFKYKYRDQTNLLPPNSSGAAVSVAAPPPLPPLTPSSSSMYSPITSTSAADFSTNENNITYFG